MFIALLFSNVGIEVRQKAKTSYRAVSPCYLFRFFSGNDCVNFSLFFSTFFFAQFSRKQLHLIDYHNITSFCISRKRLRMFFSESGRQ